MHSNGAASLAHIAKCGVRPHKHKHKPVSENVSISRVFKPVSRIEYESPRAVSLPLELASELSYLNLSHIFSLPNVTPLILDRMRTKQRMETKN